MGHSYEVTRENAADAVLAQALDTLDFPALVRTAYDDGVRLFVEVGPGGSCSRMITTILGERPHRARSACVAGTDGVVTVLRLAGAAGVPNVCRWIWRLCMGLRTFRWLWRTSVVCAWPLVGRHFGFRNHRRAQPSRVVTDPARLARVVTDPARLNPWMATVNEVFHQVVATEKAHAEAHEAYLRFNTTMQESMASTLAFQTALLEGMAAGGVVLGPPAFPRSQCVSGVRGGVDFSCPGTGLRGRLMHSQRAYGCPMNR